MGTYVVLANFTDQGIRSAKDSPKRAEAFKKMAETFGVTVKELFWTQGRYDIVTILDAPDEFSAMTLNLSLGALGNVRTESLRAFSAADMTNITGTVNEDGQLVEDSGQVYDIAEDEVGMQAMEHSGEKIAIEGTVQEEDGSRVIVIKSFKLLD